MKSQRRTIAWVTTAITVAVLANLLWMTGSVQAGPLAQVPLRITYQGRLTDPEGNPLTGDYDFYFRIYNAQSGGTCLWQETQYSVSVASDGVFTVQLGAATALDPGDFNGSTRWLEVRVREAGGGSFTTLSPRQPLVSVPYAIGADTLDGFQASQLQRRVSSSCAPGWSIRVINADGTVSCEKDDVDDVDHDHWGETWTGSGKGLTLSGGSTGLEGRGYDYGVYGRTTSSSTSEAGVYGYSAGSTWGVYGTGDSNSAGVIGVASGGGIFAVRGSNSNGVGGYFWNQTSSYYALIAHNSSNSYPGLRVDGTSDFWGYATFHAGKSGYVVDIALNDDTAPLDRGDVVVISGYAPAVVGEVPVIKVRKASEAYDTGVVGIVDIRQVISAEGLSDAAADDPTATHTAPAAIHFVEGAIERSDYLLVVTLGAFKAIKVDASYGAIQPGDLLATSPNPGHAMKAAEPRFGTIIGKALGSLDSGTGVIPVFVTLH